MANSDPWIGTQVGNYRIAEIINSGTFGSVYKGKHLFFEHDPVVAIKLPRTTFHTEEERSGFIHEAQLQRQLQHPHILPILDAGFQNSIPYLVTLYAAGGSLRGRLDKRNGQLLPLDEALVILTQIGQALHYAHQYQPPIVHRDLKPENILFDEKGNALLADFGIAVLLSSIRTGLVGSGGTPPYMAPEQFEGLASPKSDQYALGCMAYELVTGRKVFSIPHPSLEAWWYHHARVEPVPPRQYNQQLPASIEQAILTAIAKDRANRHRDVSAFILAMTGIGEQSGVEGGMPDNSEAWVEAGMAHFHSVRYEEALTAFDRALALDPTNAFTWTNKGLALALLGREEATAAYDRALTLDPTNAFAWINKGNILYALEQHEEALVAYDRALALDPNQTGVWYVKGLVLVDLGRYEEALAAYDRALTLDPANVAAWTNKGTMLAHLGRHQEALAACDSALALDPTNVAAWTNMGTTLALLGRYEEAIAAYDRILALDPNYADAWANKGLALNDFGHHQEALAACDRALALDPNHINAWFNKGLALAHLGHYEEALATYDRALALDPNYIGAWFNKGNVSYKLGHYDVALVANDRALALSPNDIGAWFNKGNMLYKLGRYEESLAAFDCVLALDPNHLNAWNNKGVILRTLGRVAEAAAAERRA